MLQGMIFAIKHYALHDGPGIRTTVFLKGCPLSCSWCHNPESQRSTPELLLHPERCIQCGRCRVICPNGGVGSANLCTRCGACVHVCPADAREMVGRTVTVGEVMAELRKDIPFYDQSGGGVTFSGGEPLCQADFLIKLLDHCRSEELHRVVDTSGFADRDLLLDVAKRTDLFLYDLKHMDSRQHERLVGVPNELILGNLRALARVGVQIRIRMPIIPGSNDDEANIDATGSFAASLGGINQVDILPYHGSAGEKYRKLNLEYRLSGIEAPSDARMTAIAARLRGYGLNVRIGG